MRRTSLPCDSRQRRCHKGWLVPHLQPHATGRIPVSGGPGTPTCTAETAPGCHPAPGCHAAGCPTRTRAPRPAPGMTTVAWLFFTAHLLVGGRHAGGGWATSQLHSSHYNKHAMPACRLTWRALWHAAPLFPGSRMRIPSTTNRTHLGRWVEPVQGQQHAAEAQRQLQALWRHGSRRHALRAVAVQPPLAAAHAQQRQPCSWQVGQRLGVHLQQQAHTAGCCGRE